MNFTTPTQKMDEAASSEARKNKKKRKKRKDMTCRNHTLAVGFIKFSSFAQSEAL